MHGRGARRAPRHDERRATDPARRFIWQIAGAQDRERYHGGRPFAAPLSRAAMSRSSTSNPSPSELETTIEAESLFHRLERALPCGRVHELLLHDASGELFWRSGGSGNSGMPQDLHEALDAFVVGIATDHLRVPLDKGRTALLLPARTADGTLAGTVTAIVDSGALARLSPDQNLTTPALQSALAELAEVLASAAALEADLRKASEIESGTAARKASGSSARHGKSAATSHTADAPAADAWTELDRVFSRISGQPFELHVQPLARVRGAAQSHCFEVLLRSPTEGLDVAPRELLEVARRHGLDSMIDRRVLSQLIAWLVRRRDTWSGAAPCFSVNLSETSLREEHFLRFVELCLKKSALPAGWIAFEVPEAVCIAQREAARRAIAALAALGCPIVIDDFSMHPESVALFETPGITLAKLDPKLTDRVLESRVAAARVTGMIEALKLLEVQIVAKRVERDAEREWLTAQGVDFVQSFALAPPRPLAPF